jgi:hypothetical protein
MCHNIVETKLTQESRKVMETDVKNDPKVISLKIFLRIKGSIHTESRQSICEVVPHPCDLCNKQEGSCSEKSFCKIRR